MGPPGARGGLLQKSAPAGVALGCLPSMCNMPTWDSSTNRMFQRHDVSGTKSDSPVRFFCQIFRNLEVAARQVTCQYLLAGKRLGKSGATTAMERVRARRVAGRRGDTRGTRRAPNPKTQDCASQRPPL